MRIENKAKKKHLTVDDLHNGDCFMAPNKTGTAEVFIVTDASSEAGILAMSMCDGNPYGFTEETKFIKLDCHLVIDDMVEYK